MHGVIFEHAQKSGISAAAHNNVNRCRKRQEINDSRADDPNFQGLRSTDSVSSVQLLLDANLDSSAKSFQCAVLLNASGLQQLLPPQSEICIRLPSLGSL